MRCACSCCHSVFTVWYVPFHAEEWASEPRLLRQWAHTCFLACMEMMALSPMWLPAKLRRLKLAH